MSCTSLFNVYQAIFTQFFFAIFTLFSCASYKSERTCCIFVFFKDLCIFSRMVLQNSRTIPGQKALFFKFQEFSKTRSNSRTFPGLFEPCKSMSHIICHINPHIQFVDICWGHGMRSQFHPL